MHCSAFPAHTFASCGAASVGCRPAMAVAPEQIRELARKSILLLLVDRDIAARPERVPRLESALAAVLAAFESERAPAHEPHGVATGRLLDRMVGLLLSADEVDEVFAPVETLRRKLRWVLAGHAEANVRSWRSRSGGGGGSGGVPPGSGSAGPTGAPAEARVADSPPPAPPETDDDLDMD